MTFRKNRDFFGTSSGADQDLLSLFAPIIFIYIFAKMHFSCTFRHCPFDHLLSICNFPFSIGLFVTYLFSKKKLCKNIFLGQNLFHVIYNHNLRSNVPLQQNSQIANRKGGNPFGQPDRRFPISIFSPSQKGRCDKKRRKSATR